MFNKENQLVVGVVGALVAAIVILAGIVFTHTFLAETPEEILESVPQNEEFVVLEVTYLGGSYVSTGDWWIMEFVAVAATEVDQMMTGRWIDARLYGPWESDDFIGHLGLSPKDNGFRHTQLQLNLMQANLLKTLQPGDQIIVRYTHFHVDGTSLDNDSDIAKYSRVLVSIEKIS